MATLNGGGGSGRFSFQGVSIKITKVENGFIFELDGMKRKENANKNDFNWESFQASFVFPKLEEGLSEVQRFFNLIEEQLIKATREEKKNDKFRKVHATKKSIGTDN